MGNDAKPDQPAVGCGPNRPDRPFQQSEYQKPTAAWGAAKAVGLTLLRQRQVVEGAKAVFTMNQDGSFDCPGCAWPDDPHGLRMDICENGIKHVTWEMTGKRTDCDFFAKHTVSELMGWSDFALEDQGRLTEPMRYDPDSDKYVPVGWDQAFALIGNHLRGLDSPNQAVFYTSGRLSNEGTFLYQLFAREFGTNNLPDCSNMCHEASGRALRQSIGTNKGTVDLLDWEKADAVFVIGVNAASNAPRMLTALVRGVKDRGMNVVHINPLIEAATHPAITPHEILDMALFRKTPTSSLNLQVRIGGDLALMRGIAKRLFELAETDPEAIDLEFIERHTHGFAAYRELCRATPWADIERQSGVNVDQIDAATQVYRAAKACIISWCLGISQQQFGVETVREITNVLLLRGNLGRPGAGACPIRGHSNVQGNRTCGVNHQPTEEWLARLDAACGIRAAREKGLDTVHALDAMARGEVKVFMGMGGNFAMATPDRDYTFAGLSNCDLTVHVSTKLNRSHLVHGKDALILPSLGRTEEDLQAGGPQAVTVEDSMSMVHLSRGKRRPASEHLRSEPAIIACIAKATLPNSVTPWDDYVADYDRIRDTMAKALVGFEDFNRRVREPHGFRLHQPARERVFTTSSGKAEFSTPELPDTLPPEGRLVLCTVRSHDQWNTTIYSDDDRYRGIKNLRTLIFLNADDMRERGIEPLSLVNITSFGLDGSTRCVRGFRALRYNIPRGCAAGYMPEFNVLIHHGDYSATSDQPLMKQLIVAVEPAEGTA